MWGGHGCGPTLASNVGDILGSKGYLNARSARDTSAAESYRIGRGLQQNRLWGCRWLGHLGVGLVPGKVRSLRVCCGVVIGGWGDCGAAKGEYRWGFGRDLDGTWRRKAGWHTFA